MNAIVQKVILVLTLLGCLCPTTIFTSSLGKCPKKCICDLDIGGLYMTRCIRANLREWPTNEIDRKMEIIEIENPSHAITIAHHIFDGLKDLKILRIRNSGVPAVGMFTFWGVGSLQLLDLEGNNITHINLDNFKGLQQLHELNLSRNRLGVARIPSGTFQYLRNLTTLRLEANMIEELIPRVFQSLKNLRFLDLSGNPLGSLLPDAFRDIPELKTLKCRQCALKQIKPEVFHLIPRLVELNLGVNQFRNFDNELAAMKNLRVLILDHNRIHEVTNRLFSFHHKSLEHLDLSRNGLTRISDKAFHSLIQLTHLDISYNKFTTDDFRSVAMLQTLKALNISGNVNVDLSHTRDIFTRLPALQLLSIADIVSTPVDFFSYVSRQLKSLNISGANLRNDSLLILNPLTSLVELDLSRNAIKGFSDELVDKLVDIANVVLESNPIICDVCNMEALHNRVNEIRWLNMPKCSYPRALRGKFINRINKDDLSVACLPIDDYVNSEPSTNESILLYFMHESRINLVAILLSTIFVLMILIFVVSISICSHQTAHYYTKEDGKQEDNDRIIEDSLMSSTEISFKFPLSDEAICSTDEICIPPPTLLLKKT